MVKQLIIEHVVDSHGRLLLMRAALQYGVAGGMEGAGNVVFAFGMGDGDILDLHVGGVAHKVVHIPSAAGGHGRVAGHDNIAVIADAQLLGSDNIALAVGVDNKL